MTCCASPCEILPTWAALLISTITSLSSALVVTGLHCPACHLADQNILCCCNLQLLRDVSLLKCMIPGLVVVLHQAADLTKHHKAVRDQPGEGKPAFHTPLVLDANAVHAKSVQGHQMRLIDCETCEVLDHGCEGISMVLIHVLHHIGGMRRQRICSSAHDLLRSDLQNGMANYEQERALAHTAYRNKCTESKGPLLLEATSSLFPATCC